MIPNTADYISLMTDRASGALPDMGSALRVTDLLRHMKERAPNAALSTILDVGSAAGHFYRTFTRQGLLFSEYAGLEVDSEMVAAAQTVWASEVAAGSVRFINQDLEQFDSGETFDFVICINSFMYFGSARTALSNLMRASRHHLLIRSYFTDSSYRIMRAQTRLNHDKATLDEIDVFDDRGDMRSYDFWNIYSFTYMEELIRTIDPRAHVEWLDDRNPLESMEEERRLNVRKRGATEVLAGMEISYPFILPWKYLSISFDRSR